MIALLALLAAMPLRAGTLTLDADRPVIAVTVEGVPLILRVDLDQGDVVELNPGATARLPLKFGEGFVAQVGNVELPGRQVAAVAIIDGVKRPLLLSIHGRDCCVGVDGALGPMALPYAVVRFERRVSGATTAARYVMADDGDGGLSVAQGPLAVRLTLAGETVASRAAAVRLSDAGGGRYAGPYLPTPGPFGVMRSMRPVAFSTPPVILGFTLPRLMTRATDYGGRLAMPEERAEPGDIVVARAVRPQREWPLVTIGREYLDGCAAIIFHADTLALELDCDFTRRPD